jgi:hypothetical protein
VARQKQKETSLSGEARDMIVPSPIPNLNKSTTTPHPKEKIPPHSLICKGKASNSSFFSFLFSEQYREGYKKAKEKKTRENELHG